MKDPGTILVGGGLASQRAAETLRRRGYEGPVRIVCAETEPPYDRPPLSKQVLAGTASEDSLAFRAAEWYAENGVELLLGERATALDPERRELLLASGERLAYGQLLIATGGEARRLPFLGHENVHALRGIGDARALRAELRPRARLAIVGAGFIGQEVAATARGLGVEVTIIEALPTPLAPILGAELGRWFAELHAEEGTRLITGAMLEGARGGERVGELVLADGRRVECDVVLVGVGTVPAAGWLRGSGLDERGVRVDAAGRTALPGVFAAGDASVPIDTRWGGHARTEHWDAAAWQGAAAARAMLGEEPGRPPLPSFWSDQYGVRIQCVGHPQHADAVAIDGDPAGRDFEAVFSREGVPVAGLTVGRPRAIPALRKRIENGARPGAAAEDQSQMKEELA
ncbi:MAG: FAD-dependent oxidoreductase [Solirubrobacterales bacterium]